MVLSLLQRENRVESMRQCLKCNVCLHEECVGLDSNDEFVCPDCSVLKQFACIASVLVSKTIGLTLTLKTNLS